MELTTVLALLASVFGVGGLGTVAFVVLSKPKNNLAGMMGNRPNNVAMQKMRDRLEQDETGEEFEKVKQAVRKKQKKKSKATMAERLFRAGIFSDQQKKDYRRLQIFLPIVCLVLFGLAGAMLGGGDIVLLGILIGGVGGMYLPLRILDRKMKQRDEDIMFYLPLVIEQISIGVSSSLDTGPCLQQVITMADERDSHNSVTELLRYSYFYVKSGSSLEEGLTEVGNLSGHTELKHAFMALAQVSKFGGEVTRQLQELADAVSAQRETRIEAKIKRLELEATAPVGLVFMGYILILLTGFGLQIITVL